MTRNQRIALAALIAVVTALSLSSCAKVMDTKKVEKSITGYLNESPGEETFDKVNCPEDQDAKAGVDFECTFEGNEGTTGKVKVAVKNTKGDADLTYSEVKYKADLVEKSFTDQYGDTQPPLESIVCPDDLPSKGGSTFDCELTGTGGEKGTVPVTLTDTFQIEFGDPVAAG